MKMGKLIGRCIWSGRLSLAVHELSWVNELQCETWTRRGTRPYRWLVLGLELWIGRAGSMTLTIRES